MTVLLWNYQRPLTPRTEIYSLYESHNDALWITMDIRQLRYFLGIVEQRSLSRAAEFLHVAQPALTLHLKRLELEFGCQLVERTSRGVVPTEFGHRLAQRAKVLLEDLNHLRDEVRGMTTAPAGSA